MTARPEADTIAEPQLRELYLYWSGKRGQRPFPARADILPEEIKRLLPFVLLVDVLEGGSDFRYRLVGTDAAVGIDPTGKLMSEALPPSAYRDHIAALFRRGAEGPGALYSRSSYGYSDTVGPRSINRLLMPRRRPAGGHDADRPEGGPRRAQRPLDLAGQSADHHRRARYPAAVKAGSGADLRE